MTGLFVPLRRATLLIPSGPPQDPTRKHLFIVVTDPQPPDNQVLVVGCASVQNGMSHDPACILQPGDHPFFRHPTYVNYRLAYVTDAQLLIDGVRNRIFVPREVLVEEAMARVLLGLQESRFVKPAIRKFLADLAAQAG